MRRLLERLQNLVVIRMFIDPLKVIPKNYIEFLVWFTFTFITGQIGIIANYIIRFYSNSTSLKSSIYLDSVNGSFYTFSIAIVASILGPLFINFLNFNNAVLRFKTIKILLIITAFFFLFFSGIVYAVVQSKSDVVNSQLDIGIDWTQTTVYIVGFLIFLYGYCFLRLENNPQMFARIDDQRFHEQADQLVNQMVNNGNQVNDDGQGVAL